MTMYEIIQRKRDGHALSESEIRWFVEGYTNGTIPDYQAAALCMAIYFQGMDLAETTALSLAIRDSGTRLCLQGLDGVRVDKHSTGGVGDKTSLIVAPIVASCGLNVAKMSGRGLGHTGGTVDKLEAIPGFCTELSAEQFVHAVKKAGLAIAGQSDELAPADKRLYALRDVTATVDSMPLIASSIMGKKLAADDDCIVLDVKTGSGAFMKKLEDSRALAEWMVKIGQRAGKRMCALITDMDRPLGRAVGNALEVVEAIEVLRGGGEEDLIELSVALATRMLLLAEVGSLSECEKQARTALSSGAALERFAEMVKAQGGDVSCVDHPETLVRTPYRKTVCARQSGFIASVDTERYGQVSLLLGAGRHVKGETIDLQAGFVLHAKTGERIEKGEPLAVLYSSDATTFAKAEELLLNTTRISDTPPQPRPLIFDVIE